MKIPEFILKIDWSLLRNQKNSLLHIINDGFIPDEDIKNDLLGILALIDAVQDYAVDDMGINENDVYAFEEEIQESTGIKTTDGTEINVGDKIKQVWICDNCGSDNVQSKQWVNLNDNSVGGDAMYDDDDYWCEDCQEHHGVTLVTLKDDAKVIGFQVVGEEGEDNEGEIHPDMDGSFCIYNLSQAREMLNKENDYNWRLLTIWEGDVEELTMMFEGNPRD